MSLNLEFKKSKLIKEMKRRNYTNFELVDEKEDMISYASYEGIAQWTCIVVFTLGITTDLIYFYLGPLDDNVEKKSIIKMLNICNSKNPILTFYLDEDNTIIARTTYISNEFDAKEYLDQSSSSFAILREFCPQIMPFVTTLNV